GPDALATDPGRARLDQLPWVLAHQWRPTRRCSRIRTATLLPQPNVVDHLDRRRTTDANIGRVLAREDKLRTGPVVANKTRSALGCVLGTTTTLSILTDFAWLRWGVVAHADARDTGLAGLDGVTGVSAHQTRTANGSPYEM